MCEMLNLFVPARAPSLGPPVRGLHFGTGGEIQRDFAERYRGTPGVILCGACASGCLCGFTDWDALYALGRDVLERNALESVSVLHFWSKDRYALTERIVDPDDPDECTKGTQGEVIVMRVAPPERRRHRRLLRALVAGVGSVATLRMKRGDSLHGTLVAFDPASEVGTIADHTFVAAQVFAIEPEG